MFKVRSFCVQWLDKRKKKELTKDLIIMTEQLSDTRSLFDNRHNLIYHYVDDLLNITGCLLEKHCQCREKNYNIFIKVCIKINLQAKRSDSQSVLSFH